MHLTKRLLGTLVMAFMLTGMFAAFGIADPGPNGNNDKGLCTAYFNGQKKGHDKQQEKNGEYPGPFQALQDHAENHPDNDEGYEGADAVYWYCMFAEDGPGFIGGNPDHNGRWECSGDEDEVECDRNDPPNERTRG